jgi:hypothetical protein
MAVTMAAEAQQYLLIIEKTSFSWAFWFLCDWFCRPFAVHVIEMPPGSMTEDTMQLSRSSLQRNVCGACYHSSGALRILLVRSDHFLVTSFPLSLLFPYHFFIVRLSPYSPSSAATITAELQSTSTSM